MNKIIIFIVILSCGCINTPIEDIGEGEIIILNNTIEINNTIELTEIDNLTIFLESDSTNEHIYNDDPYFGVIYNCGFFARDLSRNASKHNISIGGAMVGTHPRFNGCDNHAINYIIIDEEMIFIEPQNDMLLTMDDLKLQGWGYIRLWEDGSMMPTNWRGNRAYDIKIE